MERQLQNRTNRLRIDKIRLGPFSIFGLKNVKECVQKSAQKLAGPIFMSPYSLGKKYGGYHNQIEQELGKTE